jgi:hypothetical protein
MLSVGPFSGQYQGENDVWYQIRMHSEGECRDAAQDMMTTHRIFQNVNPNLRMDTMCRKELLAGTYEQANSFYPKCINYRMCLDMFRKEYD